MNNLPERQPTENELGERLLAQARGFAYPPTPDVSRVVVIALADRSRQPARRRLALVLALLALILAAGFAVPTVRAAVLDWIRVGAVQIFLRQPGPSPTSEATAAPGISASPTPLQSVLDILGETTLSEAQSRANFPISMPAFPTDLGQPDHIFMQDELGGVVVLVWMNPDHPDRVRMSLSETATDQIVFQKIQPTSVADTQVGGEAALWIDGSYLLTTRTAGTVLTRLVQSGHTLVWTKGAITYRLETDTDLETAIRIAESLK